MSYVRHRLTLSNVKRLLVACLNDVEFTRLHALIKRTQYAKDPEQFLIWALDASSNISEIWGVGLFLLSHLSDREADLVAILVRTCNFPRGIPAWRFNRAALASLRWKAHDAKSWKQRGMGPMMTHRRLQRERLIRDQWAILEGRLKRLHEQALGILDQREEQAA